MTSLNSTLQFLVTSRRQRRRNTELSKKKNSLFSFLSIYSSFLISHFALHGQIHSLLPHHIFWCHLDHSFIHSFFFFFYGNGLLEDGGGKSGAGEEEERRIEDEASREGVLPWQLGRESAVAGILSESGVETPSSFSHPSSFGFCSS